MRKKIYLGTLIFSVLVCIWTEKVNPQRVPTNGLSSYAEYRQEILKSGWIPKQSAVSSVKGWSEVICGTKLCNANFTSSNGKKILSITIWVNVKSGKTEYYVAPAFNISEAETNQNIQWIEVSGTDQPSLMNPDPSPASIGSNTIERRGEEINFDAIIDGQYVRYSANCQTRMLYRLKIGSTNKNRQPINVKTYPNEQWFRANTFQSKVLETACSR
jgi:hypothetical protein